MRNLTATICLTLAVLFGSAGVSFALPPCPSDQNQYYDNCFGTFTFGPSSQWTGDKYVGEFRNGKRNGQGTYTFATGDKYVGQHRNGKRHGQGTFTFANGNKYVGEFRNGKFYGQGTFTIADGRIKEGFWKDNKIQYALKGTPPMIARKSPSPTRLELARRTQAALQVLGLYSGKLDGIIGVKTRSGIQRWQKRNGYAGTGEVTEAQLTKLEQEAITLLAEGIPKTQGRGTTTFNAKKDRPR